jgi:hypothetical protein
MALAIMGASFEAWCPQSSPDGWLSFSTRIHNYSMILKILVNIQTQNILKM